MLAYVFIIVFLAIFTQSLAGFGLALVSVPILAQLIGVHTTTPTIVLIGIVAEIILLLKYRSSVNIRSVWQLTVGAAIGIPLGVAALEAFDERFILTALGVVVIAYAVFALLNSRLPDLQGYHWPYGIGLISGILGGAYNFAGPLVVIYGHSRNWEPAEFKGNLQGFFLMSSGVAVVSHALSQNFTAAVWHYFVLSLPAIGLGLWAGLSLDKYLHPDFFRKIVLIGLIFAGLKLMR